LNIHLSSDKEILIKKYHEKHFNYCSSNLLFYLLRKTGFGKKDKPWPTVSQDGVPGFCCISIPGKNIQRLVKTGSIKMTRFVAKFDDNGKDGLDFFRITTEIFRKKRLKRQSPRRPSK